MDKNIYLLVEAENTSKAWKIFHIIILITASLSGLCAGVFVSQLYTNDYFLCSDPKISSDPGDSGPYIAIIRNESLKLRFITENKSNCDFTLYAMIFSSIFGVNWAVFFTMCGPGGKSKNGLPQAWRIVLPALLFSTVIFVVDLAAGSIFSVSVRTFCKRFEEQLLDFFTDATEIFSTQRCDKLDFFIPPEAKIRIQSTMTGAEVTIWLCAVAWGCNVFLCCLRIVLSPDFSVQLLPTAIEEQYIEEPVSRTYEVLPSTSTFGPPGETSEKNELSLGDDDEKTHSPDTQTLPTITVAEVIQRVFN